MKLTRGAGRRVPVKRNPGHGLNCSLPSLLGSKSEIRNNGKRKQCNLFFITLQLVQCVNVSILIFFSTKHVCEQRYYLLANLWSFLCSPQEFLKHSYRFNKHNN